MQPASASREALVAALRHKGVDWLAPSDAQASPVADAELIGSLALNDDSRLRAALTGLFLLQPSLAAYVSEVVQDLNAGAANELRVRYTAAVYLQHLWRTRLTIHMGPFEMLPDLYSQQLGLPDAQDGFGKPGLYALADWHQMQSPVAFNRLSEYSKQIEFVFAALEMKAGIYEPAAAG